MIDNISEKGDGIIPMYRGTQVFPDAKKAPSTTNPLSEFKQVPANPSMLKGQQCPPGMMMTHIVTQELLDEASRALDRPLWDFEVKILDMILIAQGRANIKLEKMGKAHRKHSADQVVTLFVSVVKDKEADAQLLRVMNRLEHGGN